MFALYLARVELIMGKVADARRHALEARNLFRERQWINMSRTALDPAGPGPRPRRFRRPGPRRPGRDRRPRHAAGDLNDVELGRARAWAEAAAGDLSRSPEHLRTTAAHWPRRRERPRLGGGSPARPGPPRLGRRRPPPACASWSTWSRATWPRHGPTTPPPWSPATQRRSAEVSLAFEAMGAWLVAAEASASAAVVLRRTGDARRAAAAELRAAELARRCQGAMTPALRAIQTQALLSSREIEVAALAAAGLANKDIAGRLSVSVRTVENHLQRVYEKLGVARRADLAQALGSV